MANATDIITLAEAKRHLSMEQSDQTKDVELAAYITGVSEAIDGFAGPVVIRTVTDELHPGGEHLVFLRQYPVDTITTVTEYLGTSATVLTAETPGGATTISNYFVTKANGMLRRQAYTYPVPFAGDFVKVTYEAGRYADTTAVSATYKLACCLALAETWRSTIGGGNVAYGAYEGESHQRVTWVLPLQAQRLIPRKAPAIV